MSSELEKIDAISCLKSPGTGAPENKSAHLTGRLLEQTGDNENVHGF